MQVVSVQRAGGAAFTVRYLFLSRGHWRYAR